MNADPIAACFPGYPAVSAQDVRMTYGSDTQRDFAVDGVSFDLFQGQSVGLVGPNGSGKSTLVKMIAGLYPATSGLLRVFGGNPTTEPDVRARLSYVPASDTLLSDINVRDNLMYRASLRGLSTAEASEQVQKVLNYYGLEDLAFVGPDALSTGQKRRITFASAVLGRPGVLLLDEPTTGVDINALRRIHDQIDGWRSDGHTLILATHHTEELFDLCDLVLVLSQGRVTFFGPTKELGDSMDSFRRSLRKVVVDED